MTASDSEDDRPLISRSLSRKVVQQEVPAGDLPLSTHAEEIVDQNGVDAASRPGGTRTRHRTDHGKMRRNARKQASFTLFPLIQANCEAIANGRTAKAFTLRRSMPFTQNKPLLCVLEDQIAMDILTPIQRVAMKQRLMAFKAKATSSQTPETTYKAFHKKFLAIIHSQLPSYQCGRVRATENKPRKSKSKADRTIDQGIHRPLIVHRPTDNYSVQIYCPGCSRSDFANLHGFRIHCQATHGLDFDSEFAAIIACGRPTEYDSPQQSSDEDAGTEENPLELENEPFDAESGPPDVLDNYPTRISDNKRKRASSISDSEPSEQGDNAMDGSDENVETGLDMLEELKRLRAANQELNNLKALREIIDKYEPGEIERLHETAKKKARKERITADREQLMLQLAALNEEEAELD